MSSPAQVEFFFTGPPLQSTGAERVDYAGFSLNGVEYRVGDCAFLYPEDEAQQGQHYVAQVKACFQDTRGRAADPHCVEVAWLERRTRLEVAEVTGPDFERSPQAACKEVVALEETDINPIGCISGKALVFKAPCYEEACRMAKSCGVDAMDWFFCRGVYRQNDKCIVPFPEFEELLAAGNTRRTGKRAKSGGAGHGEVVADSDDVKRQRYEDEQPAVPVRRTGKLVSGRTCVECGATQTPQWREGPAGPKTLCNACGVRYGRAQQRANKRAVSSGFSRAACGAGGGGRNGRTSKAARSDAAHAHRGAARAAAASGAAEEAASQRPLRQAALMSASRTAAYARTGFFPVNSAELEMQMLDVEGEEGAEQEVEGAERDPPPPPQQHAGATPAGLTSGAVLPLPLHVPLQGEAAAALGGAAGHCSSGGGSGFSPNCSSLDSSDSPAQANPAGAGSEGGAAQVEVEVQVVLDGEGEGGAGSVAAGCKFYPLVSSQHSLLVQSSVFTAGAAAAAAEAFGCETPLPLPPAPAAIGYADGGLLSELPCIDGGGAGGGGVISDADADACAWMAMAADTAGPCGADPVEEAMCALQEPAAELGDANVGVAGPSLSGGDMGLGAAGDGSCAQAVSAPVSPSAAAGAYLPRYSSSYYGSCSGMGGPLDDDEYGPLVEVEVDYGLGAADEALGCDCMAGPDLFDEMQESAAAVPVPLASSAADLPAVAAAAARYCPTELGPGTAARELLDAIPRLLQPAQSAAAAAAAPADVAGSAAQPAAPLLPASAVAPLVALGRQVGRASCEAAAADAALQAVSQVLEAHQDAARRAREAAAANLGRLHSCLSSLAGHDAAAAALAGMGLGMRGAAASRSAPAGASHLVDLRDLCGGGMGAYGRDAEMVVAVRS